MKPSECFIAASMETLPKKKKKNSLMWMKNGKKQTKDMNKWLIGEEKEKCEEDYSKILFYHQVSKDFFFFFQDAGSDAMRWTILIHCCWEGILTQVFGKMYLEP